MSRQILSAEEELEAMAEAQARVASEGLKFRGVAVELGAVGKVVPLDRIAHRMVSVLEGKAGRSPHDAASSISGLFGDPIRDRLSTGENGR